LLVVSACGGGRRSVLVPPALDLRSYGRLGLVTFTVENAKGSLHEFATERFSEDMLAAQPGIEVLELGTQDSLLRRVGENDLGIAAAQELGKQREVGAVFAGHLKVTNPKGTGGLAGLVTPHLEATVRVDLTVRLLSTRSGPPCGARVPGRPSGSVTWRWWAASSTSPPRILKRRTDRW